MRFTKGQPPRLTSPKFAQSPLITPARLHSELVKVFEATPCEWAKPMALADPDLLVGENVCVIWAGEKKEEAYVIDPVSLAALLEFTRFPGISVTTNTRGKKADPDAEWYLKLTFTEAPDDNTPVWRLVADAMPHEKVAGEHLDASRLSKDWRLSNLHKTRGGTAKKAARCTALGHAETAARTHAPIGFNVAAYVANIQALFAEHDKLYLLADERA